MNEFNVRISGPAGSGVKIAGQILGQALLKQGYYVHGYTEYPSLIRGGCNTFQIHAAKTPLYSQISKFTLDLNLDSPEIKPPKNISALGIIIKKLGLNLAEFQDEIKLIFKNKGVEAVRQNLKAL